MKASDDFGMSNFISDKAKELEEIQKVVRNYAQKTKGLQNVVKTLKDDKAKLILKVFESYLIGF